MLYARVSTEEQTEKYGLDSQVFELEQLAQKSGYVVVRLVKDSTSGATLDRPGIAAIRELVRNKSVEAVLVHDPDRLSRKLAHHFILAEEFENAGVRLEFVTTPSADSTEGRLLFNMRGVIAEFEREKIADRTMRGRKEKARQGLIVGGRNPYGYRVEKGISRIDKDEARVVVQIFEWLVKRALIDSPHRREAE